MKKTKKTKITNLTKLVTDKMGDVISYPPMMPSSAEELVKPEFSSLENYEAIAKQVAEFVRAKKLSTVFMTKAGPREFVGLEGHLFTGKLFKTPIVAAIEWTRPLTLDMGNGKKIVGWEARARLMCGEKNITVAESSCMND